MELLLFYGVANSSDVCQRPYFLPIPASFDRKTAYLKRFLADIGKKWYKMRVLL